MILQPWLYALVVAVGGFHVLVVLYAYRLTQASGGVESAGSTERSEKSSGIDCPECGTTNERGYRYCANCVSELPGGSTVDRMPTAPDGRQIF